MKHTPQSQHNRPIPTLFVLLVSVLISVPLSARMAQAANHADALAAGSTGPTGFSVIGSDEHGILLEWVAPPFQLEITPAPSGTCAQVSVPGYGQAERPGWPALPVTGALVGIPAASRPTLRVMLAEPEVVATGVTVCPVPRPVLDLPSGGLPRVSAWELVPDPAAYATAAPYPEGIAAVTETAWVRSQRVARITLSPFRYEPSTGRLLAYRRVQVRLDFGVAAANPTLAAREVVEPDPFEQVLAAELVNYQAAQAWRVAPRRLPALVTETAAQSVGAYKVLVDRDGIYQLTYTALANAGVPVGNLDPRTLRLHNGGQEVAIAVLGEGDGVFGPGDVVLFYGRKMTTRFTDVNVYWLSWGEGTGKRMALVDGSTGEGGAPPLYYRVYLPLVLSPMSSPPASPQPDYRATVRLEQDRDYKSNLPSGAEGDRWYWTFLHPSVAKTRVFTTVLSALSTRPASVTVSGLLKGVSGIPQHHTLVFLNGHLIDDALWPSQGERAFTATVPQAWLIEGTNTISVHTPYDGGITMDYLFVNWFSLDYSRRHVAEGDRVTFGSDTAGDLRFVVSGFTTSTLEVFDIRDHTAVARVLSGTVQGASGRYTLTFRHVISEPHRYVVQSSLQRLSPRAIVRDQPSSLRSTSRGADYIIITHGDFIASVQPLAALRASQGLRVAVANIEDVYDEFSAGVFDPEAIRSFLAYAYANWVSPPPSFVLLVGDGHYDFKNNFGWGERIYVPPYLADVDPWMGETAADNRYACVLGADTLPDIHIGRLPVKTAAEADAVVAKIVGYEETPASGLWNQRLLFAADNPDDVGDFYVLSDGVADHYVPPPYSVQKVYYGRTHTSGSGARNAILAAIREGRLIVNYVGHAAYNVWAQEQLLRIVDLSTLTNGLRLPLMVPMTCLEGYFVIPSPPGSNLSSLAESIVRVPNGGALASWSPTGLGLVTGHDLLDRGLFDAVFRLGVAQIGPATLRGKLNLYASGGNLDLVDTYVLLGDPASTLMLDPIVSAWQR